MNKFLDEIKVLMHENGYSIEDIKKVVDSFNNFISYVSRNRLEGELEKYIDSFRTNMLRRIRDKNKASNIASVAEFNGTSLASRFVNGCVERRVQSVLHGFLKSSEIYYNMACNSEGVDEALILAQLKFDGIVSGASVELTAPTTIMSFSTELNLKTLYSIKNYNAIVKNCYSKVTECVNGIYPNEYIFNDRLKMIEIVSGDWKNIGISTDAQNMMNMVRDSYPVHDKPVNLPDDDKFGNVKVNGHTLYKVFDNLPVEYRSMIKYQVATAFSRGDKKSLHDKVVSAIDYFLLTSKLDTTMQNMDSTKQMIVNSNNFDRMRYLIDQLGSEELLFSMAYATSSYIVAKNEVDGRSFSSLKNSVYLDKGLQYSTALEELVNSDSSKKYLLDFIVNNKQILNAVKTLNAKDLYVLIDMFSYDEIIWMKESCNMSDSCSFREMLYYCIFFKRHVNNYEFIYDGEKYKNINRLFYAIKSTNNLAMLGSQISQWFAEISVYSLSQEEFDALRIFDNEFIYNSLCYKDKVMYKKCIDRGVPFKIYYTSSAYTSVISRYMDSPDFSPEDFDNQVGYRINRGFNRIILVNDQKLNTLKENVELHDILTQEFGAMENVPNFLISLPLDDIRVIVDYCRSNNQSLKEWSAQLLTTPCFFCRSMFIVNKVKSCYENVKVRVVKPFDKSRLEQMKLMFSSSGHSTSLLPHVDTPFIVADKVRAKVNDMDSYLRTVYQDAAMQFELKYEKETDKDLMNYLLANGFDYLTASYLQKNASRETVDKLIEYVTTRAIPSELLTLLGSNRITIDELVLKNQFFVSKGCRLDDIPIYYYTSSAISISTFEKLFVILDGIYGKANIPLILLTNDTDKVQVFVNKLKEAKVNIYDFMSYLDNTSALVLDNVDRYIYIYKQLKNISVTSGMVIKPFDVVVADYDSMKAILGYTSESTILLKSSLYSNFDDLVFVKNICDYNNKEFLPELLFFERDFVKEFFDSIYLCAFNFRMTNRILDYEDCYNYMKNSGWFNKVRREETNKARKVS